MWQRVQTLYLLLALTCVFLAILFPLLKMSAEGNDLIINAYGAQIFDGEDLREQDSLPLYIIYLLTGFLISATLLLFKNRKLQLTIGRINFLINFIFVVFLLFFSFWGVDFAANIQGKEIPSDVTISTSLGLGFFFSVAVLPLLFLANLGIKRDEKLVRSLDRLR